jgi:hypothetical protein
MHEACGGQRGEKGGVWQGGGVILLRWAGYRYQDLLGCCGDTAVMGGHGGGGGVLKGKWEYIVEMGRMFFQHIQLTVNRDSVKILWLLPVL